ncbi:hypothetical protein TNCV_3225201 [Trichonephila clavipes]|nr:hypothetical protein TNCV_3225201 [Trichonephila clavipes]
MSMKWGFRKILSSSRGSTKQPLSSRDSVTQNSLKNIAVSLVIQKPRFPGGHAPQFEKHCSISKSYGDIMKSVSRHLEEMQITKYILDKFVYYRKITRDLIFKKFGCIDPEKSVLKQPPLAIITTLIRLGIQSNKGWMACTGTDDYAASTRYHSSSNVVTDI